MSGTLRTTYPGRSVCAPRIPTTVPAETARPEPTPTTRAGGPAPAAAPTSGRPTASPKAKLPDPVAVPLTVRERKPLGDRGTDLRAHARGKPHRDPCRDPDRDSHRGRKRPE
ncbi:hypothetical protein BX257_5619 [Streptomyces sp. 3212.3]|nr:hypothetical protein BX257_5619 [Streptomyces sp. 3212.3]